jgi:DNA-binding transcriptional MerR regulator
MLLIIYGAAFYRKHMGFFGIAIDSRLWATLYTERTVVIQGVSMLRIKQMIQATGLSADTLRYYESLGLLLPASRLESGYRLYDEKGVARARFIRNCQTAGFTLNEIKQLIQFDEKPEQFTRAEVKDFVTEKLKYIETRLTTLNMAKELLETLAAECSNEAASAATCPILKGLHGNLSEQIGELISEEPATSVRHRVVSNLR